MVQLLCILHSYDVRGICADSGVAERSGLKLLFEGSGTLTVTICPAGKALSRLQPKPNLPKLPVKKG